MMPVRHRLLFSRNQFLLAHSACTERGDVVLFHILLKAGSAKPLIRLVLDFPQKSAASAASAVGREAALTAPATEDVAAKYIVAGAERWGSPAEESAAVAAGASVAGATAVVLTDLPPLDESDVPCLSFLPEKTLPAVIHDAMTPNSCYSTVAAGAGG